MARGKNTVAGNGSQGIEGNSNEQSKPINPADFGGSSGGSDGGSVRDATGAEFDPSIHVGPDSRNNDGSFRKRKGRKAGGTNNSKAKVHQNLEGTIEALTKGLAVFHIALASATKTPELVIADDEAKSLASASVHVLELYDIRPDPKIEAIVALIGVSAAIYVPRIAAIKMRKAQEKAEEKPNTAGVYDENGFPAGTTFYTDPSANPLQ